MKGQLGTTQRQVLDFIAEVLGTEGFPPTVREVQEQFQFKSSRAALYHLEKLEEKGWIERDANRSRGIRLMEQDQEVPTGLPIVGRIAAGTPALAEENLEGYFETDEYFAHRGTEPVFLLRVEGESMIEAGIHSGDLAVIRQQQRVENGEIGVAVLDGEATLKRIREVSGGFMLEPENETMDPIRVSKEHPDFHVEGKLVGVIRRFG